ncbi:uncharacterized protein LOC135162625 [Diachasmimorpha longicaudata]|uniref:uncharacterized protein LOC135162625 n=1 Tax=Diachasmimorpha longicaudata TaxID=58733 RepID=UPI0030B90CF1
MNNSLRNSRSKFVYSSPSVICFVLIRICVTHHTVQSGEERLRNRNAVRIVFSPLLRFAVNNFEMFENQDIYTGRKIIWLKLRSSYALFQLNIFPFPLKHLLPPEISIKHSLEGDPCRSLNINESSKYLGNIRNYPDTCTARALYTKVRRKVCKRVSQKVNIVYDREQKGWANVEVCGRRRGPLHIHKELLYTLSVCCFMDCVNSYGIFTQYFSRRASLTTIEKTIEKQKEEPGSTRDDPSLVENYSPQILPIKETHSGVCTLKYVTLTSQSISTSAPINHQTCKSSPSQFFATVTTSIATHFLSPISTFPPPAEGGEGPSPLFFNNLMALTRYIILVPFHQRNPFFSCTPTEKYFSCIFGDLSSDDSKEAHLGSRGSVSLFTTSINASIPQQKPSSSENRFLSICLFSLKRNLSPHPRSTEISIAEKKARVKSSVEDDINSPALDNFLKNVLRAKDELKSIDRTINPGSYRTRSSKRRLLWSKHGHRRRAAIRDYRGDKDADGIGDRSAANEVDIETILGDLGFSGENSPARNLGKNMKVERRRYPISDLTGSGIIEYYDYEGDMGKRDSMNSINASGSTTMINMMETIKKEVPTVMQNADNTTLPYPRQEFLSAEVRPEDKKFIVDLDDQASENREDRDMEVSNDLDGDTVGREARCHRDEEDGGNGMLLHSHFLEIQEYEIIPGRTNALGESNIRSPKASNPRQTFFVISPVNSPKDNSSSSSGSDYQALKVIDDMFKGGVEQGNSLDNSPNVFFPNANEIQNDKHWKSLQEEDQKAANQGNLKLIRNGETPFEIHREPINKETSTPSKQSRGKRSSEFGPIMRYESIVEPYNWPWQDYDSRENTKMGFGRELMQAFETNSEISEFTSSERIPPDGFSRSVTRHRDTNQNFKEFWHSRALTYLHRRSRPYFKGKQKFFKNRSTQLDTMKRVKRSTNRGTRVGRLVGDDYSKDVDQMGHAVRGDLAAKIVDKIFEQVHKNEPLKTRLGPGLTRRNKPGSLPPAIPGPSDPEEIKRTEEIMKKVMELLGHLVSSEVHHKTCTKLPPHLHEFLVWMVGDEKPYDSQRTTGQPVVHPQNQPVENSKPETFQSSSSQQPETQTPLSTDLYRKVRLLKGLIKEYLALSDKEQTKVQAVHDYLERQLHLLLKYIESKEKAKPQSASPKKRSGSPLHSHPFASQLYHDDDELQDLPLKAESYQNRRRRQVKKRRKKKKYKAHNHKKNKHGKKTPHHKDQHFRSKRSIAQANYLPWEVPRILDANPKFLSNVSSFADDHLTMSPVFSKAWISSIKDDELKILFEGPQTSKGVDKFSVKSSKTPPPTLPTSSASPTLSTVSKIHSPELITARNSSITAASLLPKENSEPDNTIENKGDNSGALNSLESRINVFPVSP